MQSANQAKTLPGQTFRKEVKKHYSGPASLILFITGIVYLVCIALSFLNFILKADYFLLPLGDLYIDALLSRNLLLVFLISFFVLTTLINFIGISIVHFHGASGTLNRGCVVGFYLIKVTKLIQHILIILLALASIIQAIAGLNDMIDYVPNIQLNAAHWVAYWCAVVGIVVAGLAIIIFHLMSVISVSVMKEAVSNKVAITNTHLLSAAGYFLLGIAVLFLQFITGFNFTIVAAGVYCILWGLDALLFRNAMKRIGETD